MDIDIKSSGTFEHTESFLRRMVRQDYYKNLDRFAKEGVDALSNATPRDTGTTAASWTYEIVTGKDETRITWTNDNYVAGYFYGHEGGAVPIVILIQYGHATRNGGYVPPYDFINPTIKPLYEKITNNVWKEVTKK